MSDPLQPSRTRLIEIIALITASLAPPGILINLFSGEATQHPWLTFCLVIGYEVVLWGIHFAIKIWADLEKRWTGRIADWLDHSLQTIFSRYRHRYLKWMFYQHRDFDVKGLSTQGTYNLELEQVFVDLAIEPRPAHTISTNPIQLLPTRTTGRQQIWDYLKNKELRDHLVLVGPPGSGKTTLLKKIALRMAGQKRLRISQNLPVLLYLREHAEAIGKIPGYSLAEAIKATLARKEGPSPPGNWFEKQLKSGRCLVLFDGLDEVANIETRQKVVAWVEARMKALGENRFIISSRPHGYRSNPISSVTVLEVQPFNPEQIERFVYNWYKANEVRAYGKLDPGVEMQSRQGAKDLLRRLRNSQNLTDLAVNPLLLTMIATVHRFRSTLPGRRVQLYSEICEVFLGKRLQARGLESDLAPPQKQRVLQALAYYLMRNKVREISLAGAVEVISEPLVRAEGYRGRDAAIRFLRDIENSSGLLLERESQIFSFAHLAFQEFLASAHAHEQDLEAELIEQIADPWWHEAILLYCAQGDASNIIEACLLEKKPTVASFTLAIGCLGEALEVDPKLRVRVDSFLAEAIEADTQEKFRLAAETMLGWRLRNMEPAEDNLFFDQDFISNAEYQLFVDDMAAQGIYLSPDHWKTRRFPVEAASLSVVGIRCSDAQAFCGWLTSRETAWRFRLPNTAELVRWIGEQNASRERNNPAGYWLETGAFEVSDAPVGTFSRSLLMRRIERDLQVDASIDPSFDPVYAFVHEADSVASRSSFRLSLDAIRKKGLVDELMDDFGSVVEANWPDIIGSGLDLDNVKALAQEMYSKSLRRRENDIDDKAVMANIPSALGVARLFATDRYNRIAHLSRAVELALAREYQASSITYRSFRRVARILALTLMETASHSYSSRGASSRSWGWLTKGYLSPEEVRGYAARIYVSFAILESRIEGELPAVEGIRIVKERIRA